MSEEQPKSLLTPEMITNELVWRFDLNLRYSRCFTRLFDQLLADCGGDRGAISDADMQKLMAQAHEEAKKEPPILKVCRGERREALRNPFL